jgi:phage baseplate assembly protein W
MNVIESVAQRAALGAHIDSDVASALIDHESRLSVIERTLEERVRILEEARCR